MYRIECWKFNKKVNSTALPADPGTQFEISLKKGCSVLTPSFYINTGIFDFNYLKFNERYFWVLDIVWERDNLAVINCGCDVLASWKNEILSTTAYVNYSASVYDPYIRDERIPVSQKADLASQSVSLPGFNSTGSYLLSTIGSTQGRTTGGFINIHAVSVEALNDLSVFFSTEEELITQITSQFGNAFGCIVGLKWIPYSFPDGVVPIYLGNQNSGVTGYPVFQRNIHNQVYIPVPWFSNDFRRYEPYSQAYIFLPFVGVIPINLSDLAEIVTLTIDYTIDLYTGDIAYSFINAHGKISVYSGNIASDIPVSSYQRNLSGVAVHGLAGNISTMTGAASNAPYAMQSASGAAGFIAGIAGGLTNNFANMAVDYLTVNTGLIGGFSGNCGFYLGTDIILVVKTRDTSQAPSMMKDVSGRPCGRTLQMNLISGYVETASFKVDGNMTITEKQQIESYMKGGVYIE